MKRDMELIRKILLTIEDKYVDVWLSNNEIKIDEYDMKTIGYHCAILYDAKLLYDYKGEYAGDELYYFGVGRLTWEGHEFLDKIRDDNIWNETKKVMKEKRIPFALDSVKLIASSIVSAMVEGAIKGLNA